MLRNALKFNELGRFSPVSEIQERFSRILYMFPKNLVRPIGFLKSL